MEIIGKKTNKIFGNNELNALKEALPSHYYKQFERIWGVMFKKDKCPTRQNIYAILSGNSENDKVIEVLIELVRERNALKKQLISVTSYAEEQEA